MTTGTGCPADTVAGEGAKIYPWYGVGYHGAAAHKKPQAMKDGALVLSEPPGIR